MLAGAVASFQVTVSVGDGCEPVIGLRDDDTHFVSFDRLKDRPEELLTMDAGLLTETLPKVTAGDLGQKNGIDNPTTGIVDDHTSAAPLTNTAVWRARCVGANGRSPVFVRVPPRLLTLGEAPKVSGNPSASETL